MSLENQDWTRSPAFEVEVTAHPELGPEDFGAVIDRDRARAGVSTELSTLSIEIQQDEVLNAMARAQTTSLRDAMEAVDPSLANASDTEITEAFFALQLSNPSRALTVMNESISNAASIIEGQGYNSTTLGAAITRAAQSLGHNLEGAVTDLSNMSTEGLLTVAGVGFGSFILTGSPVVGAGLGGFMAVIQSPHLTDATINIGSAAVRGATQAVALPVRGAMRTVDIINGLGRPGLGDTIVGNAQGMANDVIGSIAYTFDGDFDRTQGLSNNAILQEFYEQGEIFAPGPLMPFVRYLREARRGGPITALPSEAEARTAGAFIARVQNTFTPDEFLAIEGKRTSGQELTPEENRQYVAYKYAMIVNASFIGDRGMPPYAQAFNESYNSTEGIITLDEAFASLTPAQLQQLDDADFHWSPQQVAQFEANVEGLEINFENLTANGGFVGLALTAYLALAYADMAFGAIKSGVTAVADRRERARANRRLPDAERTISAGNRRSLISALSDDGNRFSQVTTALVGARVLHENTEFQRAIRRQPLSAFGQNERQALLGVVENENATRGEIRAAFFTLLESNTSLQTEQREAIAQRQDFYTYRDALNRIDNFYRFDPRGTRREISLGDQTYTIGRPERGDFTFTTVTDLMQISNPRNFYRYMTNSGNGRTLRMRDPQNNEIYLRVRYNQQNGFQFNNRTDGWQTFDLEAFATSVRESSATSSGPSATS